MNSDFKIVFMGSPSFGLPALKSLIDAGYTVPAVVTVPDKQKGRGQILQFSDVKNFAVENNLPFLQPESLKDENFISELKKLCADLFVVIAFRILPESVFTVPRLGSVNLHASLLPKYRGAAPINHAIINGEKETGVTTFFLEKKIDTGNIILQKTLPIRDEDDFGTMYGKLSDMGSGVILETVEAIQSGSVSLRLQSDAEASPAPKIFKNDCRIDWNKSALNVHNLIRGLSPVPCAFTHLEGKVLKVYKSFLTSDTSDSDPGTVNVINKKLFVCTADKKLEIIELQTEGRKRIPASDFVNGLHKDSVLKLG
ncbi:MAG: methionyl-tRNA formyltransferase [Ignavibacteriae bacterium]|nr:methionyl-tRNA formyltransferase [Ignavibacteriota bacterium]